MKKTLGRFLSVLLLIAGIFIATAVTTFFLTKTAPADGMQPVVRALIAGGVVAVVCMAVLFLLFRRASMSGYSGYALEEMELDEDELTEAVTNWVFMAHRRRVEENLQFLEDENGHVSCRVKIRKD